MARKTPFGHNKRLSRMLRLLARIRPHTMPVTYRHNRVALFPDGPHFFKGLLAAIRSAECMILLEYYIIRNDHTGNALASELVAAVQRGVRVLLIYDYIGCIETPSVYFRNLSQQGIELIPFNVPSFRRGIHWFDRRNHRKMTIIDSRVALLGGFNIADEYAGDGRHRDRFRDLGFSVSGSVVQELIGSFGDIWQMERDERPDLAAACERRPAKRHPGDANVAIISGVPHQRSSSIRSAFLFNIASASEELLVANPYFVPGPRIIRALLRASRRGVRVRLLMSARSDVPLVQLVGRSSYGTLLQGGIEIFEMEREMLHAKVMLVDGERSVIGSANLDQRSFHRNFEINCVIDSSAFGAEIRDELEADFNAARRVSLDRHEDRGIVLRALEKIVNLFSWFL
ncbi:MAG: cardiolipin synthase B [Geobacteraceae bacterium]|nr:cardiolipin synthase B [Geobacteraceae bacterium]